MNGNVKFEDALDARLKLINPSRQDIQDCLRKHPPVLTPGIADLMKVLHDRKIDVFLVSGGFRLMIAPVAKQLAIPEQNIFANTIFFDSRGQYAGFDPTELTSRDGGKAKAIKLIKSARGYQRVAMVGDGVTDLQARPPADIFIGFGGIVARPNVKKQADWFVTDFGVLQRALTSK